MRKNIGFKLRSTVNAIVLATVLATVVIISFVAYQNEKKSLFRLTFQLNEVYADKIAETTNFIFKHMMNGLAITGESVSEDLTRSDLKDQLVRFQEGSSFYNSVFIVDKEGTLIVASNLPSAVGSKLASAGATQALREQRELVSEPYVSTVTNKLIVMVSAPLHDASGNYIGFIGGSIRLHETNIFQTVLGSVPNESDGSYAYVVSSKGVLLYHPDSGRIGEKVTENPVVSSVVSGLSGSKRIVNTRGVDMLASYAPIGSAGWGIVAQTPAESVLESAKRLIMSIMLYMLPALMLFVVVITILVRKLSEPLVKLTEFASLLSPTNSGADELPKIHGLNYEANELHKAFGRAVRHFRYQFDSLSQEAQTDPLTGLFNRRTMDKFIGSWIASGNPFSLLVMDLDHFKSVNDTYGHDVGDEVLKFLATSLRQLLKENNVICRFGGEEFIVLVPDELFDPAMEAAERIRKYMSETNGPTGGIVTLSIGAAHYPDSARSAEQLFRVADEALYRAKHQGRNRVEIAHAANDLAATN
ncbi:sensor domain-containing diguanylate cyclase [Cohnella phaseoli]|uniref:Diguanylate cyclase (GGDEF)-like protein n=1 Tax=Cohnella phaseoli TaxID=456490 RepID=A0A3D9KPB4_9BACL|nr:sensor domain-containing diguanylate cyclase [Cohnella phaseoli]RED87785.1 diguanylate cyclase (GGDEF)-like protein [Cohnella phaseoli]